MRAVKAKQLRSIASYAGKRGLPNEVYVHKPQAPKLMSTGKVNEDGTPNQVVVRPVTVSLGECVRKVYKTLKAGVLNGN
jgi:hypothetical protein